MKPCVSTVLNGGAPFPASDNKSEDWNQPRCWSLPSRYISACQGSFVAPRCCSAGCGMSTERDDDPESIHTSSVSADFAAASGPDQFFGRTSDQSSEADFSNQTFDPCCWTTSATARITCGSKIAWPCAS